jgi:hypothetical protein
MNSKPSPEWNEVKNLCERLDRLLYTDKNKRAAIRELPFLRRLLATLPHHSGSILQEEALALCAELDRDYVAALEHRKAELLLIKLLHKDVMANDYSDKLKEKLLKGYGPRTVTRRQEIIKGLKVLIKEDTTN